MKILIINGSPRKKGITSEILHIIYSSLLEKADVESKYIDLIDFDIKICNGCCSCYKAGSCYIKDDAEKIVELIADADGVVIGSPTYASNVSGLLKVFIDRGHFVIEQSLYGKYAIIVATGENYGNKDTSKVLKKLLYYSGARLSGNIVYTVPFNSCVDKRSIQRINKISNVLYMDVKKKRNHILQALIHGIIFNVGIKPFVVKKGDAYNGVIRKWNAIGIKQ